MKYIHALTGLRGLAALIVFISHSAIQSMLPAPFGLGFGQVGVMLFFVLSGFLITHLYVREEFNHRNVKKYILARIARVIPLYILLLFLSLFISETIYPDFFYRFEGAEEFFRALLFIDAPFAFWTIPVEVQFYIVFIGFWYVYKKFKKPYLLFIYVGATLVPSVLIYVFYLEVPKVVSLYSYAFFIGAGTALIQDKIRQNKHMLKLSHLAGLPLLFLLFINLPILRQEYGLVYSPFFYFRTWGDPLIWFTVYGLFICAILNSKGLAILNTQFFVYLGKVSYGFYLMHYPIIMLVKELDVAPFLQCALAFSLTAMCAYLSYHYFEVPWGRKIRRYFPVENKVRLL